MFEEVGVDVFEEELLVEVAVKNADELTVILGRITLAHLVEACALEQHGSDGFSPSTLQY